MEVSRSDKLSLPGFENLTAGYNKFLRPNFGGRLSFLTRTSVQRGRHREKRQQRASGGFTDSTLLRNCFRNWEEWIRTCTYDFSCSHKESTLPLNLQDKGVISTTVVGAGSPWQHVPPLSSFSPTCVVSVPGTHHVRPAFLHLAFLPIACHVQSFPSVPPGSPLGSFACSKHKPVPQQPSLKFRHPTLFSIQPLSACCSHPPAIFCNMSPGTPQGPEPPGFCVCIGYSSVLCYSSNLPP